LNSLSLVTLHIFRQSHSISLYESNPCNFPHSGSPPSLERRLQLLA
jgi:hypothetical protein